MTTASPPSLLRTLFIRYGAPTIAIFFYFFCWLLYLYRPSGAYESLLQGLGVPVWPYPFLDLEYVLTAIDCARQDIDATLPNACMAGGLFLYSPLVLKAAALPLDASHRVPLGLSLDGLFLLSLYTLPRPRRWGEFWMLLLAALSSSTLYAVERANIDVLLYLLVLAAVHLLTRGPGTRLIGYATLLGAAAIKFYPACLMVLAARERPGRFLAIAMVSLAAALSLIVLFASQLGQTMPHLPPGNPFNGTFAAASLPRGLGFLVNGGDHSHGFGLATLVGSTIFLTCFGAALVRRLVPAILPVFRALPARERLLLLAGSASIVFCFFTANNYFYRAIFLLLTLPGLWSLQRAAEDRALGERFRLAAWVVVGLLWGGFYSAGWEDFVTEWPGGPGRFPILIGVWALRELLWWWLASLLVSFTLCFLWDAPVLARWRR